MAQVEGDKLLCGGGVTQSTNRGETAYSPRQQVRVLDCLSPRWASTRRRTPEEQPAHGQSEEEERSQELPVAMPKKSTEEEGDEDEEGKENTKEGHQMSHSTLM